jgi:hypothetical protein
MQRALRFRQLSALGLVFVLTLAVLILASVLFVIGVSELLGVERQGVANPLQLLDRLF